MHEWMGSLVHVPTREEGGLGMELAAGGFLKPACLVKWSNQQTLVTKLASAGCLCGPPPH